MSRDASGYDAGGTWGIRNAPSSGGASGGTMGNLPEFELGSRVLEVTEPLMRGTDVAFVQRWVGAEHNGSYGDKTKERVQRFQRIVDLDPNGVVGPETWRAMRVT